MEVTTEIQKQYRSGDAWFAQIGNVVRSLFWAVGTWIGLLALGVGIHCIGAILFSDWVPKNDAEFREAFNFVVTISAGVSAFMVLLFRGDYFSRSFRLYGFAIWPALSPEKRLSYGGGTPS